jgi:Phage integrase, N-terminal SAM-like domain
MTLSHLFVRWQKVARPSLKATTYQHYVNALESYVVPVFGDREVAGIERNRVLFRDPSSQVQPEHDSQYADLARPPFVVCGAERMAKGRPQQRSKAATGGKLRRTKSSA